MGTLEVTRIVSVTAADVVGVIATEFGVSDRNIPGVSGTTVSLRETVPENPQLLETILVTV